MRLIDAERVRAEIFKASMDEHFMPMKLLDCDTVTEIIDNAPTIEERKTGRWIWTCGGTDCHCSLCNVSPLSYTDACGLDGGSIMVESMEFCPCCGAKMEGAEE